MYCCHCQIQMPEIIAPIHRTTYKICSNCGFTTPEYHTPSATLRSTGFIMHHHNKNYELIFWKDYNDITVHDANDEDGGSFLISFPLNDTSTFAGKCQPLF